jgi:hypothetical protein
MKYPPTQMTRTVGGLIESEEQMTEANRFDLKNPVYTTCNGVVPFPLARRCAFVERHARLIATMRPDAGERYLDRQLQIQFENLQRRGFNVQVIEREVTALDAAIRTALWRTVLTSGQPR